MRRAQRMFVVWKMNNDRVQLLLDPFALATLSSTYGLAQSMSH